MKRTDFALLKTLCALYAPSGNETAVKNFLLDHIAKEKKNWKTKPGIYAGENFQDCIILVFGKPRTAIFAHMDSIGFTVRYQNQLVKIGGPRTQNGIELVDDKNRDATLHIIKDKTGDYDKLEYRSATKFTTGTEFTFKPKWRETKDFVQCCYMDNRLGIYSALQVAETLENGAIVFSCWEEHGGGSVSYLQKFLQEKYKIKQALISDITWVTEGVKHGKGVAISMRDSLIPRRSFVQKIISLAKQYKVPYQLEVEGSGGSDAKELQMAEYPWDWCFVGAPEDNVHTPDEKVHKADIASMIQLYRVLMKEL
ncbi:MAG TPA: M20/M25/M40 family metallo-hydrolase [Bacteroidia bacterium]|nr:M20/M25/M40 family metallo-hydrolase [Bacteroidia bacterium]